MILLHIFYQQVAWHSWFLEMLIMDLSLLFSVQKNIPMVFMIHPSLMRQCFLPIKSIHLLQCFFYHNLDKSKAGCIALVVLWATNFIGYLFVIRVVKRFFVACKKYRTTFDIDINIDIYISRYSDNTGGRGGDAEGGIGKIIVALVFSSSYISHHLRYIAYSYMFLCLYKLFRHVQHPLEFCVCSFLLKALRNENRQRY